MLVIVWVVHLYWKITIVSYCMGCASLRVDNNCELFMGCASILEDNQC